MNEQLRAQETEVLLLGGGSRKGAERLSARHKLPFPVLVDPDRAVYRRYGLDKVLIALQRSGTFLIDKQGIVRYIHQSPIPRLPWKKAN
jgi:peroxiredoxin Q/BCP